MKRYFYHGTSADNLPSILKHGLSCNEEKLWNVSEDCIYLWCPEAVGKEWELEEDEDKQSRAFQAAFESGQFACSVANDCRVIVLKIELDDTEIFPDTSSENMEGRGAVCLNRDISISEIKEIMVSNDLSLLKGYFLALGSTNEYSNIELSDLEKKICKAFEKMEIYPEDIDEMVKWEPIRIPKRLKTA